LIKDNADHLKMIEALKKQLEEENYGGEEFWRKAGARWQAWGTDLVTQPEGGLWGDDETRRIIAEKVQVGRALLARIAALPRNVFPGWAEIYTAIEEFLNDRPIDMHDVLKADASSSHDPVCVFHGKKRSEHNCVVCCLCYRDLGLADCHVLLDGLKENVCHACADDEKTQSTVQSEPVQAP
jgi:hypothetical protein